MKEAGDEAYGFFEFDGDEEMAEVNGSRPALSFQITQDPLTGKKCVVINGKMMPLVSIGMPVKVTKPETLKSPSPLNTPPPSQTPPPPKPQPRRTKKKRVQITEVLRNLRVDNKLLTKDLERSQTEVRALKRELVKTKTKCSTLRKELLKVRAQLAKTRRSLIVDGQRPAVESKPPIVVTGPSWEILPKICWEPGTNVIEAQMGDPEVCHTTPPTKKNFWEVGTNVTRVQPEMEIEVCHRTVVLTKPELHSEDSLASISTEVEQSYLGPLATVAPNELKFRLLACLRSCDIVDANGDYPIHHAVQTDIHAVRRQCAALKFRRIPVDLENHEGYTPLHLAVMYQVDPSIIEELIKFGADLAKVDKAGNNILHLATSSNYLHVLEARNLLGDANVHHMIDSYNYKGLTPLMLAAMKNHSEDAEVLLKRNANVDLQDRVFGRTALFHAVENKSIKLVELLLNYDADKKSRNFLGLTILDALVDMEVPKSIMTLITAKREDLAAKRTRKRYPTDAKLQMVSKKVNIQSLLR